MNDNELKVFERKGNKEFKIELLEEDGYRLSNFEKEMIMGEDLTTKAYEDTKGIWTNGVGLAYVEPNSTIDLEEAIIELRQHLRIAEIACDKIFNNFDRLIIPVQEALIEMAYNLGETKLRKFKKFIEAIHKEDYTMAIIEALDSNWAFRDVKRTRAIRISRKLYRGVEYKK